MDSLMDGLAFCPELPSTMDGAADLVRIGNPDGLCGVVAGAQTAGRGRLGRVWQTFANRSVAVTFMMPAAGEQLPLVVALGLFEAVKAKLGDAETRTLALKWPNDLLLGGKKVAGILIETMEAPPPAKPGTRVALVGIGLNLVRPEEVPASFEGTFMWPDDTREWSPDALLEMAGHLRACIVQQIDIYETHGWTPEMRNRYASVCATLGRPVTWAAAPGGDNANTLTGTARGLNQSGHLELVAEDGTVHVLCSGLIIEPHTT